MGVYEFFSIYSIILLGKLQEVTMIYKIVEESDLLKIKPLFNDIRFYMGNSVLDGVMGEAYVDDIKNPNIAFLLVRSYCFISGNISESKLKEIIDKRFRNYKLIPSDRIGNQIKKIYSNNIQKFHRYSIKKDVKFNIEKLHHMANSLNNSFNIVKIDESLANKIKELGFINITDDYKKNGIGFCCIYNNEIIGVASSNIFYKDGIEVNIKVDEKYRRKSIATAMASNLILECLKQNKKVSWDAANVNSVRLAQKLGFEFDSSYNVYNFN